MKAVFVPALKNRLHDRIKALRLGLSRDHWSVVQAIYSASYDGSTKIKRHATTSEIASYFPGKRLDRYPITTRWIRKVIKTQLLSKKIAVGDNQIHLIQEGHNQKRQKTVVFSLESIIEAMIMFYNLPVSPSELHNELFQIIMERTW